MRMRKNNNSDENFASLLSAIDRQSAAPDPEFLKQLRERSAGEFAAAAPDGSVNTQKSIRIAVLGRMIMKSPIAKLAIAAVVLLACVIGLSLWKTTGSGIALADVLAQIEKVKAVRDKGVFKITGLTGPNKPYYGEIRWTRLTSQEYGSKASVEVLDPNGGESTFEEDYTLPQKKTRINIVHKNKTYTRFELDNVQVERIQKLSYMRDLLAFLKERCKYYKSLGRATINGNEVEVFQTTDPNYAKGYFKNPQSDVKIWVNVKTRLPVRYEESIIEQMGDRYHQQLVMYDFLWDVPVDAAEFEPAIPDNYTGTVVEWPAMTEPNAIQGLKQCVEFFGNYPESIDFEGLSSAFEKSETPTALRLKEEVKGLTEEEKTNRLSDAGIHIVRLIRFRFGLLMDRKDPEYYGGIVTPKDADKVLMRWKVSDSEYRVIYGDLRAETVTKEKLAELEAALPK